VKIQGKEKVQSFEKYHGLASSFSLSHLNISSSQSRSLSTRNDALVHPLLEVTVDLCNGVTIKTSHPAVVHLELLLCSLIADGFEFPEALTCCALLGLGVVGEWLVGVDEVFGSWVLVDNLVGVDADAEGEVFIEEDGLGMSVVVLGLGVGSRKVAGHDRLVKVAARNTLGRLNTNIGGDVVLPTFLLLHIVKVECGLVSCDPLDGCLILLWRL
jgi:hypothetical protein